jgi:hypothetical protein
MTFFAMSAAKSGSQESGVALSVSHSGLAALSAASPSLWRRYWIV